MNEASIDRDKNYIIERVNLEKMERIDEQSLISETYDDTQGYSTYKSSNFHFLRQISHKKIKETHLVF